MSKLMGLLTHRLLSLRKYANSSFTHLSTRSFITRQIRFRFNYKLPYSEPCATSSSIRDPSACALLLCRVGAVSPCSPFTTSAANFKKRKTREEKKQEKTSTEPVRVKKKPEGKVVTIWRNMTLQELADEMGKDVDHIFEVLIYLDCSSYYDSPHKRISHIHLIQEIVKKSGMRCRIGSEPSASTSDVKEIKDAVKRPPPTAENCVPRHPVVTVMGHVDHGKTTLLDSLRNSRIVDGEFGGITQHIGAFEVNLDSGETITFLDTPGHAAFTTMRSRGARVTDIVILVVAADDGVMEQTKESVRLANEAGVPIIVAINKIDKPEADIERTKKMLIAQGLILEEAGGDVQSVAVSALKGTGLRDLIETINTQASLLDLKTDPKGFVEGTVIESRMEAHRGKLSTAIIQRGTLRKGAYLVAGTAWAKVRAMFDERGQPVQEAPPSTPVEIIGWRDLPSAGDEIVEVESERRASEVVEYRRGLQIQQKQQEDLVAIQQKVDDHLKDYKVQLEKKRLMGRRKFKAPSKENRLPETIDSDPTPKLSVIIKGDVDGSVEAILDVLESYQCPICRLDLIHYGVGPVSEHDVKLAEPFRGIIYAFNVETPLHVRNMAKECGTTLKDHNIIYRLIDDLKEEFSKRLPMKQVEEVLGEANVLQEFIITEGKQKVTVAGCRCVKGNLRKNASFRLVRGETSIFEGAVSSMRHLKNEVDTIKKGVECGIQLADPLLQVRPGDTIICYQMKDVQQQTDWDPGF